MTQMQFSLLRLLNLQSHSTDNTFKGKGNKKRKVGSRNSLKSFRFLRFIIISFIMQEHQKEHQESKDDKKGSKSLKLPPLVCQGDYLPDKNLNGPMQSSYINGKTSFKGSLLGPFDAEARRIMGIESDHAIVQALNKSIKASIPVSSVHFHDPVGPLGSFFKQTGVLPAATQWKPIRIDVSAETRNLVFSQQQFTNHTNQPVTYTVNPSVPFTQTTWSRWNGNISEGLGTARVTLQIGDGGVYIDTTVQATIGKDETFTKQMNFGGHSLSIIVNPNETAKIQVIGTQLIAKFKVTYQLSASRWLVAYGTKQSANGTQTLAQLVNSTSFPFNASGTLEQLIDITTYGNHRIQTSIQKS